MHGGPPSASGPGLFLLLWRLTAALHPEQLERDSLWRIRLKLAALKTTLFRGSLLFTEPSPLMLTTGVWGLVKFSGQVSACSEGRLFLPTRVAPATISLALLSSQSN